MAMSNWSHLNLCLIITIGYKVPFQTNMRCLAVFTLPCSTLEQLY